MQTNNWGNASNELNIIMEGMYPKHRTPEVQAEIDKKKAQFKKNSEEFAKENPYTAGGGHASPAPRKQPGEDNEEFSAFVKSRAPEDAETESLADKFHRFAERVSALEEGRDIDVDELLLELNGLNEELTTLGGVPEVDELPAADHDAPKGGIGSRSMDEG